MFKKPFTLGNSHKISGGDRKKLRRDCQKQFGCSDEDVDALLPLKGGEVEICKCAAPIKAQVYFFDKVPLLVDITCKNDLMPTIFALWRAPNLLPTVHVKHPAVSQYIIGGADLMIPGVLLPPTGLPAFEQRQLLAIAVPGNDAPIAVGRAALSSEKATERLEHAARGCMVECMQCYKDKLWEAAASTGAEATPNSGFYSNVVLPPDWRPDEQGGTTGSDIADDAAADDAMAAGGDGTEGATTSEVPGEMRPPEDGSGAAEHTGEAAAAKHQVTPAEMDDLMQTCLLQALHKRVKDADLPMAASTLWATHVLPARPPGVHVDPKLSSHKKVSKFFQAQANAGLLRISEDKHSKEIVVQGINRGCGLYDYFRPFKQPTVEPVAPAVAPQAAACVAELGALSIEQRFRVGRELRELFQAVSMDPDSLYTATEASQSAVEYVKQNKLEEGASKRTRTKVDRVMADALFKGLLKKGESYPSEMEKSSMRDAVMKRMHPLHLLKRGDMEVTKKGTLDPLNISVAKRQGNKKVTVITGMETYLLDASALSKELSKAFACATTVTPLEGAQRKGQFEVCVQGNVAEKLSTYFESTCGIPKRFMTVKSLK